MIAHEKPLKIGS